MKLHEIFDNAGACKLRCRVGRGIASGKGKTAGRGHKGQKSRSGSSVKGFEGGQMPFYRRVPKRGFTNIFRIRHAEVTLGRLQRAIEAKKIDAGKELTIVDLVSSGLVRASDTSVRLLGGGELKEKVSIAVNGASASAIQSVEKAGGKVTLLPSRKQKGKVEDSGKSA